MNDGELVGMLTYERKELADEIIKLRKERDEMIAIGNDFANEAQRLRKENVQLLSENERLRRLNGEEFNAAVQRACDETLGQQKHRIRDLEAALRDLLNPAHDLTSGWKAVEAAQRLVGMETSHDETDGPPLSVPLQGDPRP